ncbi:DUF4825 domain-containing protein [Cellulomonas sp. WB94]|uniref:DUF4825 domain-containing protein n=1 Tax=Cellulomonas sp. WB94 TaxID=2173174 RepID=UPI001304B989|nr:DUF4825 domain-containing protein [Cellulomonas sp. WB94]
MLRAQVAVGALLIAVTLGGCAPSGAEKSDPPNRVQSLWSARTDFVGDSSRVAELADQAGFGPAGTYSLALQTKQAPYAMTVAFDHLDKPFDDVDFSANATLMLGLVSNLDMVSVTADDHSYSLTASAASTSLGFDVKELGRDETKLEAYLDLARD